jgi:hypothetical protein
VNAHRWDVSPRAASGHARWPNDDRRAIGDSEVTGGCAQPAGSTSSARLGRSLCVFRSGWCLTSLPARGAKRNRLSTRSWTHAGLTCCRQTVLGSAAKHRRRFADPNTRPWSGKCDR